MLRMRNESARDVVIRGLKDALVAHREGRLFDIHDGRDDAVAIDHGDAQISIALNLTRAGACNRLTTGPSEWRVEGPCRSEH